MIVALAPTAMLRVVLAIRVLGLRLRDFLQALAGPAACTLLLVAALLPLLHFAEDAGTYPALAVLMAGTPLISGAAAWFFARELLSPLAVTLRGIRP
jgi:hypothetical protein